MTWRMMMTWHSSYDVDLSRLITIAAGNDALSLVLVNLQWRIAEERAQGGISTVSVNEYRQLRAATLAIVFRERSDSDVYAVFGY